MRFSSIILLLGAVTFNSAAPNPTPFAKDTAKGITTPSYAKSITMVADYKSATPVPVVDGNRAAPSLANGAGVSPISDKQEDNKDMGTVKPEPFDGKSSIPYNLKLGQCEC